MPPKLINSLGGFYFLDLKHKRVYFKSMNLSNNYIIRPLLHALGVMAYTALASTILTNGGALFGDKPNIWGPITFLMFFVLSATITGLLVLGKPVTLFLEGQKKEAVTFLSATIAWLAIIISIILIIRVLIA